MLKIDLSDICDQLILMNSTDTVIKNQACCNLEVFAQNLCRWFAQGKSVKVTAPAISLIWSATIFANILAT